MRGTKDMELILQLLNDNRKCYVEWKQIIYVVFLTVILGCTCHYVSGIALHKSEAMSEKAALVGTYTTLSLRVGVEGAADKFGGAAKEEMETDADIDALAAACETEESIGNIVGQDVGSSMEKEAKNLKPARISPKTKMEMEKRGRASERAVENSGCIGNKIQSNPELPFTNIMEGIGNKDNVEAPEKIPEPVIQKEISGFICDGDGRITGYSNPLEFMKDGFVVLPRDKACTGIKAGALEGLEERVFEIYIPANITYIEKEIFDSLHNLIFIEVAPQNTRFYSQNGILYTRDGKIFAYPNMQMKK